MLTITANLGKHVRRAVYEGRDYFIAPVTLIVPGVLNGSDGPLYYSPEETARNYKQWHKIPITVYHPTSNGKAVSAKHPGILDQSGIGHVYSPTIGKGGKLQGEAWLDVERTKKVDARIYNALVEGREIEVSTGLYLDEVPAEPNAVHNGIDREGNSFEAPYSHVARNFVADHLAVLPDQVGACSRKHGCGILVNTSTLAIPRNGNTAPKDKYPDSCPECGGKVSDTTGVCEKCGYQCTEREGEVVRDKTKKVSNVKDYQGHGSNPSKGKGGRNNARSMSLTRRILGKLSRMPRLTLSRLTKHLKAKKYATNEEQVTTALDRLIEKGRVKVELDSVTGPLLFSNAKDALGHGSDSRGGATSHPAINPGRLAYVQAESKIRIHAGKDSASKKAMAASGNAEDEEGHKKAAELHDKAAQKHDTLGHSEVAAAHRHMASHHRSKITNNSTADKPISNAKDALGHGSDTRGGSGKSPAKGKGKVKAPINVFPRLSHESPTLRALEGYEKEKKELDEIVAKMKATNDHDERERLRVEWQKKILAMKAMKSNSLSSNCGGKGGKKGPCPKGGSVKHKIHQHIHANPKSRLSDLREKFGEGKKIDPHNPLDHPVHSALKELRDEGSIEAHESQWGEPSFSSKKEPESDSTSETKDPLVGHLHEASKEASGVSADAKASRNTGTHGSRAKGHAAAALKHAEMGNHEEAHYEHDKASYHHEMAAQLEEQARNNSAAEKHRKAAQAHKLASGLHKDRHLETNASREPTADNTTANGGDSVPTKIENIAWLTTNCDCWKGHKDKDILNGMPDEKVATLRQHAEKGKQQVTNSAGNPTPVPGSTTVPETPRQITFDEWMALAAPEHRQVWNHAVQAERETRVRLVANMVAGIADETQRKEMSDWLLGKPIEELKKMSALMPQRQVANGLSIEQQMLNNFLGASGNGGIVSNAQTLIGEDEILEVPTLNFSMDEEEMSNRRRKAM